MFAACTVAVLEVCTFKCQQCRPPAPRLGGVTVSSCVALQTRVATNGSESDLHWPQLLSRTREYTVTLTRSAFVPEAGDALRCSLVSAMNER